MLTLLLFPLDLTTFFMSVNYEAMSDIFFRYISHLRRGNSTWTTKIFFSDCSPLFHQMKFIFLLFHLLGCMQEREKRLLRMWISSQFFCLVCSLLSLKLLNKCFFQLQKWAGGGGRGKSDVKSVLCGCKQPKDLIS